MKIRIIDRPLGEAPDWVRDAWIGLELDLLIPQEITAPTRGVLSGRSWWRSLWVRLFRGNPPVTGFVVSGKNSIDRLATVRPDAAAWWHQHAPQHAGGALDFIFDREACVIADHPDQDDQAGWS